MLAARAGATFTESAHDIRAGPRPAFQNFIPGTLNRYQLVRTDHEPSRSARSFLLRYEKAPNDDTPCWWPFQMSDHEYINRGYLNPPAHNSSETTAAQSYCHASQSRSAWCAFLPSLGVTTNRPARNHSIFIINNHPLQWPPCSGHVCGRVHLEYSVLDTFPAPNCRRKKSSG